MGYEGLKMVIGIDIGADSLKAALMERKGQQIRCLDFVILPFQPGVEVSPEAIIAHLKEVYRKFADKTRNCAVVSADRSIQLKFFEKPDMPTDVLNGVITKELKNAIAGMEGADKLEFTYHILGQTLVENVVSFQGLSAIFPRQLLMDYRKWFKAAGLRLEGVYPFALGLWECFQMNYSSQAETADEASLTALINFGAQSNQIAVCDQRFLRLGRIFPSAGEELTQSLARTYKIKGQERVVTRDEAEQMKKTLGLVSEQSRPLPPDELEAQVSMGIRRGVERMAQKLRLSLDYFKGQIKIPVRKAYVLGGGANLRGLLLNLGDLLVVPEIYEMFPFINIGYTPQKSDTETPPFEAQSLIALAVGSGLCGMRRDSDTLNLLSAIKFDLVAFFKKFATEAVIQGASALVAAFIILTYGYFFYLAPTAELRQLYSSVATMTAKQAAIAGHLPQQLTLSAKLNTLQAREKFLQDKLDKRISYAGILDELCQLLPVDVWLIDLSTIEIKLEREELVRKNDPLARPRMKLRLRGKALRNDAIAFLLREMETSKSFSKATLEESKSELFGPRRLYAFSIDGEIRMPGGGKK